MSDPTQPAAPERIGAYRIERRLGSGGMGEVFLAWDDRLERRVAIKRIRLDTGLPPRLQERFRREARAAARLSHPSIVQIHDLVGDGSGDAIVMEYVPGVTLAERLAAGPLALHEALPMARQIAAGLAAAHAAGVIHRDLKAENVVLTPAGGVKILDFGLARPVLPGKGEESLTQRGALVGTLHAMSPEQAGGGEVDPRSDLFSFGSLLYEMLSGRPPFRGDNPLATLKRVLTETPPPLHGVRRDVPRELSALVERLLAKDRAARPESAREVASALDRIESWSEAEDFTRSISDQPTAPLRRAHRREPSTAPLRWRHGLRYAAGSLAVLAAAAAAVHLSRTPVKPLRVALVPPEESAAGRPPRLALAVSGVSSAAISTLSTLEHLVVVDPSQTRGFGTVPSEIARAAAADEVLAFSVEAEEGTTARVTLRRIGKDGISRGSTQFEVPTEAGNLDQLTDAVADQVRRSYAGFSQLPGTPKLAARGEDWAAFLETQSELDAGRLALPQALARLEPILTTSPAFLEARLLAIRIALSLFRSSYDAGALGRARALAEEAGRLAPTDPRPLLARFAVALAGGRTKEAEELLERFQTQRPGDPEALARRAELFERSERREQALATQRDAVSQVPSWQNVFFLAELEARSGDPDAARKTLADLARNVPENSWVQEEAATLELMFGDAGRAEAIFARLAARQQRWSLLCNLGVSRFLQGNLGAAAAAFRSALQLAPDHPLVLVNLADVEIDLGAPTEARSLYQRALERIDATAAEAGSRPAMDMLRAQCLARLGRAGEAVEVVENVLRRHPAEPDTFYAAALVDSLAGDHHHALTNVRQALQGGYSTRWFEVSAFAPLCTDPEFRSLLTADKYPASCSAPRLRNQAPLRSGASRR